MSKIEPKFSSWPWRGYSNDADYGPNTMLISNAEGYHIINAIPNCSKLDSDDSMDSFYERARADLNLILVAPVMFDALKSVMAIARQTRQSIKDGQAVDILDQLDRCSEISALALHKAITEIKLDKPPEE